MVQKTSSKTNQTKPPSKPPLMADNGREITHDRAILALILNIIVLPGLGTLVAGNTNIGLIQLILFLVGIPLSFILIGIPLMIGMWVWALITGIDLLNKSN